VSLSLAVILAQVEAECGLYPSGSYIGNGTNTGAVQLAALANAAARTLRKFRWQYLRKTGSQALTTGTQAYALPSDFWQIVPDTLYQSGVAYPSSLPTSPPGWAFLRSVGTTGLQYQCRIYQDKLQVLNATTGDTLQFEYVSKYPISDAALSTSKEFFLVDTDVWRLDDELLIREIKWRVKKEKGYDDWQADQQDAVSYRAYLLGAEAGAQTIVPTATPYYPAEPYTNLIV